MTCTISTVTSPSATISSSIAASFHYPSTGRRGRAVPLDTQRRRIARPDGGHAQDGVRSEIETGSHRIARPRQLERLVGERRKRREPPAESDEQGRAAEGARGE